MRVDVVLEQDGNAVQGPARTAAPSLVIEFRGDAARVGIQRQHAAQIEAVVDRTNSAQIDLDQPTGTQVPRGHPRLQFGDGCERDFTSARMLGARGAVSFLRPGSRPDTERRARSRKRACL